MTISVPTVGNVEITVHGVAKTDDLKSSSFMLRAWLGESEIAYLILDHDRHREMPLRFLESWTKGEFLEKGLQTFLSNHAEILSGKSLDTKDIPDVGHRGGWEPLRGT
jgi:hypothetical protein